MKDPTDVLDYAIEWPAWLAAGDAIATATWAVPAGLTRGAESVNGDGNVTTIWLSGGTVGEKYLVTCHVVTAGGRQGERTFRIWVMER